MKRRSFVFATSATTLSTALVVRLALGRTGKQPRRVGLLGTVGTPSASAKTLQAVRDGLRERGHIEGRDIVIDVRYAARPEEFPRLAAELAALKPSVIIVYGPAATYAALAADPEVPIVAMGGDFVETGFAADLGRPGGRVTGVAILGSPLNAKRLELLAELLPKGSAVLNLAEPSARDGPMQLVEVAGRSLGLEMHASYARTPAEIDAAFAAARKLRVAGINVLTSPFLHANRARIIEHAARAKLPAVYQWSQSAEDGGLLAYGPRRVPMDLQLADFASRILNGAKPADLPIEQPTLFELVVNLKTAKALGITIPQAVLLRADWVIE